MPPEAYLRDTQDNFISDQGNAKMLSPEMPEDCLKQAGQISAMGLAKLRNLCPIAIIQNGGEYGLNVLGWAKKYWAQDPRVIAGKGNLTWYQYISRQKAREQKVVAEVVRAATPGRLLYVLLESNSDVLGAETGLGKVYNCRRKLCGIAWSYVRRSRTSRMAIRRECVG
jgi:hypothetical protein